jgi:hypothetical protein
MIYPGKENEQKKKTNHEERREKPGLAGFYGRVQ